MTSTSTSTSHSIEETEKEILRLAKEEKSIPVSMLLDLAADKVDRATVSADADLGEILDLLSRGNNRLFVEEADKSNGKRRHIGVLSQSSVLEFLLSKVRKQR